MSNAPHSASDADENGYFRACEVILRRQLAEGTFPQHLADTVAHLESPRILDVGCGIGQALLLLAANRGASGVGLDPSAYAIRSGREFHSTYLPHAQISFLQGGAEALPFSNASFDVVVCQLALPYTNNTKSLAEMARVLKPGGVFALRIHHLRYYLNQLRKSLYPPQLPLMGHALRALFSGLVYHLTGDQPSIPALRETFQTRWSLDRALARNGLTIVRELSDSTPAAPDFLIRKQRHPEAQRYSGAFTARTR